MEYMFSFVNVSASLFFITIAPSPLIIILHTSRYTITHDHRFKHQKHTGHAIFQ